MKLEKIELKRAVTKIAEILQKEGYEAYVVGGAVRDFVLGKTPHDIDFATNATPDEIELTLSKYGIHFTSVGKKYGTIVGRLGGEEYEITTYRYDGSSMDGRHPDEVTFARTLQEDLSRRDFTMNAMALNPMTMEIIDPFGGIQDMENNQLVFVGNAEDRIKEDSLRILRAIRFAIKYGYHLPMEDRYVMKENAHLMQNLSKERKTDELRKILTCGSPISNMFTEMPEILFEVIPELQPTFGCEQNNKYHHHGVFEHILATVDGCKTDKFDIKLAALLHDIGKPSSKVVGSDGYDHFYGHPKVSASIAEQVLANDLVLPNVEKQSVLTMVEYHDTNFFKTEKQIRRAIAKFGEEFLENLLVLQKADREDHIMPPNMTEEKKRNWWTPEEKIAEMMENIKQSNTCFKVKDLAVNGNDLIELGYQGKEIGDILKEMLDAVVDGVFPNNKDTLLQFICNEKIEDSEEEKEL